MRTTIAALAAALLAVPAGARPVSWPGGLTVITELNPVMGSAVLHYTPNRHWSVGGRYVRMREEGWQLAGAQATWLVRRWNRPASQANLYVAGFAGAAFDDGGPARPGSFLEAQADWENRRLMVMGMGRLTAAQGQGRSDMQMFRLGLAPYAGDYGDVHLWLFGQLMRDSAAADTIQPALVARVFYRTVMLEAGATDRGRLILNAQLRF